jgi:hypothetical protein
MLLAKFGYFPCGHYKREPRFTRVCLVCGRSFQTDPAINVVEWMLATLDEPLLPKYDIMFVQPVKYTLPWTPEGQALELNSRLARCLKQIDSRAMYFAEPSGRIVRIAKSRTVTLPPFDGNVDSIEEWCRHVICQVADET